MKEGTEEKPKTAMAIQECFLEEVTARPEPASKES